MRQLHIALPTFSLQVPKSAGGMMGQRICGWNFKHWEGDSARMNLINLPMSESTIFKKLVDKNASNTSSLGADDGAPQTMKKPAKKGVLPDSVTTELESMGIQKKRKVVIAQSEPAAHDDGKRVRNDGNIHMDDDADNHKAGNLPLLSWSNKNVYIIKYICFYSTIFFTVYLCHCGQCLINWFVTRLCSEPKECQQRSRNSRRVTRSHHSFHGQMTRKTSSWRLWPLCHVPQALRTIPETGLWLQLMTSCKPCGAQNWLWRQVNWVQVHAVFCIYITSSLSYWHVLFAVGCWSGNQLASAGARK